MLEMYSAVFSARLEEDVKGKFFVVEVKPGQGLIGYQVEMLENNEVENIVKFDIRTKNGVSEIWYDITGLTPVNTYIEKNKLSGEKMVNYFNGLINNIMDSNKLFLEEKRFVLSLEAAFVDNNMCPKLIYLPVDGYEANLKEEFKNIFAKLSLEVEVAPGVGDMVQILTKEINAESFNFKSILAKFETFKKTGTKTVNATQAKPSVQPVPVQKVQSVPVTPVPAQPASTNTHQTVERAVQTPINKKEVTVSEKKNIGITKKETPKESKKTKEPKERKSNTVLIILIQVIVILAVLCLVITGLLDSFDVTQKVGIVIIIAALDYLVINKLNGGSEKEKAPKKEKAPNEKVAKKDKKASKPDKKATKNINNQKSEISFSLNGTPNNFGAAKATEPAIEKKAPVVQAQDVAMEEATVITMDDESTVILQDESRAYIVENEAGIDSKTYIHANPFVMGKSTQGTDLVCQSKHVSRHHAQIVNISGQYYVVDLGSTNGTFLNGGKLEPNMQYPISSGDVITLAKSEYTFFM